MSSEIWGFIIASGSEGSGARSRSEQDFRPKAVVSPYY
jgi:hypothetical protein